jgi:hypothetical protein
MKAPRAPFDVEHERVDALGQLLAHDAGGDERDGGHGGGDVAQGVEFAVGGGEAVGLADHGAAVAAQDGEEFRLGQAHVEAGIDSSLSSVPPVMPRPRPETMGTATPQQAARGARMSETLSPMPPVECLSEAVDDALELDLDDLVELRGIEAVEDDDLVDAVEELGAEELLQAVAHQGVALLGIADVLNGAAADVAGHDEHRVFEIDGAALAVGDAAIVEHLQQDVLKTSGAPFRLHRRARRCRGGGARFR